MGQLRAKSMGGAVRRPRKSRSNFRKSNRGAGYWRISEPIG